MEFHRYDIDFQWSEVDQSDINYIFVMKYWDLFGLSCRQDVHTIWIVGISHNFHGLFPILGIHIAHRCMSLKRKGGPFVQNVECCNHVEYL